MLASARLKFQWLQTFLILKLFAYAIAAAVFDLTDFSIPMGLKR